jgi:hypothetical protein
MILSLVNSLVGRAFREAEGSWVRVFWNRRSEKAATIPLLYGPIAHGALSVRIIILSCEELFPFDCEHVEKL